MCSSDLDIAERREVVVSFLAKYDGISNIESAFGFSILRILERHQTIINVMKAICPLNNPRYVSAGL